MLLNITLNLFLWFIFFSFNQSSESPPSFSLSNLTKSDIAVLSTIPYKESQLNVYQSPFLCQLSHKILSEITHPTPDRLARMKWHHRGWEPHTGIWFWPSDAIWYHSTGSTWGQVMAWCMMAPSHYLIPCWLIINMILRKVFQNEPLSHR